MLTNLGRFIWIAALLVVLDSCIPIQVGQGGLSIFDLRYDSNYRDKDGKSYVCDNEITTLTFSYGYTDFSKIGGWEAQLVGLRTGASLPKLVQSRNGGGFRLVDNRVLVDWVLAEGLAPQSIVVTPIPQPNVVGATSLELIVRATDGGAVTLSFPGIPVIDNCQ
jgi:hypothetical protein